MSDEVDAVAVHMRGPVGQSPQRRPASLRRTSSIDATWPLGVDGPTRFEARARDVVTSASGGRPTVRAAILIEVTLDRERVVTSLHADPPHPLVGRLVGMRMGGGRWRQRIAELLADDEVHGAPVFQLLDDLPAVALVSGFAHSRWVTPDELVEFGRRNGGRQMEGVCTGFRPGSSSLASDGTSRWIHDVRPAESPVRPDDRDGWHELPALPPRSMRRARRIDIWKRPGRGLSVDAWFQDSVGDRGGGRVAVHEYVVEMSVSDRGTVGALRALPRVLPYAECPTAAHHVDRLVGLPAVGLRSTTLTTIPTLDHCTHLSDAVRALADVGALARDIPRIVDIP